MKHKITTLFYLLLVAQLCFANDGAFYVNGNHLIPMFETDISVKKEILNIKKIEGNKAEINVYYEFYNPAKEKTIDVGFEAESPKGDISLINTQNVKGHPFMYDFNVIFNDNILPYKVSIVNDSVYYKNGNFIDKSKAWLKQELDNYGSSNYKYVYHFKSSFKTGLNILKHKYIIELSSSFEDLYSLNYILTAANRWSNKQIDDFTLNIDMGSFQELLITKEFFNSAKEWRVNGPGKALDSFYTYNDWTIKPALFILQNGNITFQKNNFSPKGELSICTEFYRFGQVEPGGKIVEELPFAIENLRGITDTSLFGFSKKILRNLPYARRGYVFTNPELKAFYEKQRWYMPDANYVASIATLTKEEQDWLKKLDK